MSEFNYYAEYYDLIYKDKDYKKEVSFVHNIIQKYNSTAESILELGCGTGIHANLLAKYGYFVTGVDRSDNMVAIANSTIQKDSNNNIEFVKGDICNLVLTRKFDVITALFHVVSYCTTNQDLIAIFKTVRKHIKPGGIFIFDCWYGPAVLTIKPSSRIKRFKNDELEITRIAEPVMHTIENCVDVNYQIFIKDNKKGTTNEINEVHRMRYLFFPEIKSLAENIGFKIIESGEWMTKQILSRNTWGACFILSTL